MAHMDLGLIISNIELITKSCLVFLLSISQISPHLAIPLPVVQATIFSHLDYFNSSLFCDLPYLTLHPHCYHSDLLRIQS